MTNTCAILSTGTELVRGEIKNTNDTDLSRLLCDAGFIPTLHITCGDSLEKLRASLDFSFNHAHLVITTGGLGPTKDDLTREVASAYFNKPLVTDPSCLEKLAQFTKRLALDLSEEQKQQALIPQGSIVIDNPNGTANGWYLKASHQALLALPGPPHECLPMLENLLQSETILKTEARESHLHYRLMNAPESEVASLLNHSLEEVADKIRYRAHSPYLDIKLSLANREKLLSYGSVIAGILGKYPQVAPNTTAIKALEETLLKTGVSFYIQDDATYGYFQSQLLSPEIFHLLKTEDSALLKITLNGLSHYWSKFSKNQNTLKGEIQIKLQFAAESFTATHSVRIHSRTALALTAELAALEANQFLHKTHLHAN